jgi:hypothetical protein
VIGVSEDDLPGGPSALVDLQRVTLRQIKHLLRIADRFAVRGIVARLLGRKLEIGDRSQWLAAELEMPGEAGIVGLQLAGVMRFDEVGDALMERLSLRE